MEYRELGKTGLRVSRLGLGLAALGRPGYINLGHAQDLQGVYEHEGMRRRTHAVLDAAWALGIRAFDAARSYGLAEDFLASWLNERWVDPAVATISSKWGYTYTADWRVEAEKHEVKDHSLPVFQRQLAQTQALLGHHLDLYQIHSATLESGVLEDRSVLEALAQLKTTGVAIGLSLSGERQAETLRRALATTLGGRPLFDCVQATWNLLERSAEPVLREAHAAGLGVIIKEALANGRLTPRNLEPAFSDRLRLLTTEAQRLDTTVDALALAGVLARPWVDMVLSGATGVEQLTSNARAVAVAWDALAEERLQSLVEAPEEYWAIRSRMGWN